MNRRHPRNIPSRPLVLIVDDHDDTRELYVQSLTALGFETIDAGNLEAARLLEPLALLWIHLAFKGGLGRNFGFKLLRR